MGCLKATFDSSADAPPLRKACDGVLRCLSRAYEITRQLFAATAMADFWSEVGAKVNALVEEFLSRAKEAPDDMLLLKVCVFTRTSPPEPRLTTYTVT